MYKITLRNAIIFVTCFSFEVLAFSGDVELNFPWKLLPRGKATLQRN